MASTQKTVKPGSSRWGFLSQAVASVESKLDNILADEEEAPKKVPASVTTTKENVSPSRASTESARNSSSSTTNDRLQERLARAMAKKNAARNDLIVPGSEPTSRASTPVMMDSKAPIQQTADVDDDTKQPEQAESPAESQLTAQGREHSLDRQSLDAVHTLEVSSNVGERGIERLSVESLRVSQDQPSLRTSIEGPDAALLEAQLEHEDTKVQLQNEIKGYIERIDALNAKMQYLAKEAAQSAKDASSRSEHGSLEKEISEKDERIALLLEEGNKLSITEMKNLAVIKKLRSQITGTSKEQDVIRKRAEKAEQQVSLSAEKARRAEQAARKAESQLSVLSKTSQDLDAVTRERNALKDTLAEMKAQVTKANARAESAELQAQSDKLDVERKRVAELQDDLASAQVERELAEGKLRHEIKDLTTALEREKTQGRTMESEMLAEQASLESKLESFRVRAEEASSNDQGDSQAKLLRQIETLQSQYAAASQNWQEIEGSLLARITGLEKDRDEIAARENDVRKKLRESNLKGKSSERELEEVRIKLAAMKETDSDIRLESERLKRKIQQVEEELTSVQNEFKEQKSRAERDFARRLDEEKTKWAASIPRFKSESPGTSVWKSNGYGMDHLMSPTPADRGQSRRPSALISTVSGIDLGLPTRQFSSSSIRGIANGQPIETPSIITPTAADQDDYFTGVPATPSSQDHQHSRRGLNDVISTSTVGAGPSVQLVERMSANVRRLESEKAASKDELVRLTTQRDESRKEVVRLMRDVEQKTKTESRLKQLEEEHKVLSDRYQTTLELLGEKSEQVDELKQDIADVKQMYRELADHMK